MNKAKRDWNLWLPGNKAIEAKKETKPDTKKTEQRRAIEDHQAKRENNMETYYDEY